jgi:hypothetical protein
MNQDDKDIDLGGEEDLEFTTKKKGGRLESDKEEDIDDTKDPFDEDFVDDDNFEDEEDGNCLSEGDEEANEWDDLYGYKDEYES